jgi:hypothetical protein
VVIGATEIDWRVGTIVTLSVAAAVNAPTLAVMVVPPAPTAVANPPAPIVATLTVEDDHAAEAVRSWVVLLL